MTRVSVDAGICGFVTTVEVHKVSDGNINISITSDCGIVSSLNEQYNDLAWKAVYKKQERYSPYQLIRCTRHIACPVPVAILKAVEVEMGLALPKDVFIRFEPEVP